VRANRKRRAVTLVVEKERGCVLNWAITGGNKLGEESSPCQ